MDKNIALNLKRGQEIYNTDTGEVSHFNENIGIIADTVIIETVDIYGSFHVLSNTNTELL